MSTTENFFAINPSNNELLDGSYFNPSEIQINEVVQKAHAAFEVYRKKDKETIAKFLECIGEEILNLGDALIERCHLETALPIARLQGERGRTIGQLNLFAAVVREGSWVDARIDTSIPDRLPLPKSDIRHQLIPLGPVAVFGASNFPLAFSVAGGDTASALASGCSVVVKAHPAHPGTSEMVAQAIETAVQKCSLPEGTFSLIHGNVNKVSEILVQHPLIKAVGFTGSYQGGKALFNLANSRPEPIPVFAEMGSTNPVFILPGAISDRGSEIAAGLAGSITQGVGQFCTNPGISFVVKANNSELFYEQLIAKISEVSAGIMLTPNIKKSYDIGVKRIAEIKNVEQLATGVKTNQPNSGIPILFKTSIENYFENELLSEENFGPSSVLVEADSKDKILEAAKNLNGHLTATVIGNPNDLVEYKELFAILELKVGRVLINGYPTGVEVCHSMVHGGPYPATTASQSTSVGTNAIKRFARPICFQDFPDELLPSALQNSNPLNIWRLVNGNLER
jgi:NADP-dependent aldehyde dehydrogenase